MFKLLRLTASLTCLGGLVVGVVAFNPAVRLVSSFRGNSADKLPLGEELGRKENLKETENAAPPPPRGQMAPGGGGHRAAAEPGGSHGAVPGSGSRLAAGTPSDSREPGHIGGRSGWPGSPHLCSVRFAVPAGRDRCGPRPSEERTARLLADRQKRPAAPAEPRTEERSR